MRRYRIILDLGCGYLPDHRRYAFGEYSIGIDIHVGNADILASAEHLPFKKGVFDFVYCMNLLEHLENPFRTLKEIREVMRDKGEILIIIPIYCNPVFDELIKFFVGFPFRVPMTLKRIKRWREHRKDLGFRHLNRIKPEHIEKYFNIVKIEKIRPLHPIYTGYYRPISSILRRLSRGKVIRLTPHYIQKRGLNLKKEIDPVRGWSSPSPHPIMINNFNA